MEGVGINRVTTCAICAWTQSKIRSFGSITIRNRYVENRKQLHSRAERRHSNVISSSRAFAKKLVQEQNTGKDIPLPLVSSIPNILHRALSSIRSDELSYNETKKKKKKKEKTMYRHPRPRTTRNEKRERERERAEQKLAFIWIQPTRNILRLINERISSLASASSLYYLPFNVEAETLNLLVSTVLPDDVVICLFVSESAKGSRWIKYFSSSFLFSFFCYLIFWKVETN